MNREHDIKNIIKEDRPPIFKSWNRLYAFVLSTLVALVILFYIFTKAFE